MARVMMSDQVYQHRLVRRLAPAQKHVVVCIMLRACPWGRVWLDVERVADLADVPDELVAKTMDALRQGRRPFLHVWEADGREVAQIDGWDQMSSAGFLRERPLPSMPEPPEDVWRAAACSPVCRSNRSGEVLDGRPGHYPAATEVQALPATDAMPADDDVPALPAMPATDATPAKTEVRGKDTHHTTPHHTKNTNTTHTPPPTPPVGGEGARPAGNAGNVIPIHDDGASRFAAATGLGQLPAPDLTTEPPLIVEWLQEVTDARGAVRRARQGYVQSVGEVAGQLLIPLHEERSRWDPESVFYAGMRRQLDRHFGFDGEGHAPINALRTVIGQHIGDQVADAKRRQDGLRAHEGIAPPEPEPEPTPEERARAVKESAADMLELWLGLPESLRSQGAEPHLAAYWIRSIESEMAGRFQGVMDEEQIGKADRAVAELVALRDGKEVAG